MNWPNFIVNDIARRKVVLFLGSGISTNAQNDQGQRPYTWEAFLRAAVAQVTNETGHITKLIDERDYLTACEIIINKLGHNFYNFARDCFQRPGFKNHPIHNEIFKLDSRIVATPNVDKIYDTFANQESNGTVIVKCYYDGDLADIIRSKDRLIIKVHGTIDTPDRMIFTRKDYNKAKYDYSAFYKILNSLALTHTFIFLGCGFSDPDVHLLLENYAYTYPLCRPHYMVTPSNEVNEDLIISIKENFNLELLTYDPSNNHQELYDSLVQLVEQVEIKREEISATTDW